MNFAAFETCIVPVGGHPKRGARIVCGNEACGSFDKVSYNSHKIGIGNDDDMITRHIAQKFQARGWRVGNNPRQNRCPVCVEREKGSAIKKKEAASMSDKVVMMSSTSTTALESHSMTKDERRIITSKLDDVHGGESGYIKDWSDEKVAKDLGVAQAWVTKIREDYFGPNINEQSAVLMDATKLLTEIKAEHAAIIKRDESLMLRAAQLEGAIEKLRSFR